MEPRVSNEQIVAMRKSRATISERPEYAWQDGATDLRDLYEPLVTSQKERIAALEEALRNVIDDAIGTGYDSPDDEIGYRTCCHVTSTEPHAEYCSVPPARAILTPKTTDPK